jgi:autotransporter-associated beta strand protein
MKQKLAPIAVLTALALTAASVSATNFTWKLGTGTGVDVTNFNDSKNWQPNSGPPGAVGPTDQAIFSNEGSLQVNLNSSTTIGTLSFASPGASGRSYVLSSVGGAVLTIGSGGIVNNSGTAQTVNFNLALGASETYNAASGNLLFGGSTINLAANTLTVAGASDTIISAVISGTGGLIKNGTGTLNLNGANTYTGPTVLNAGTIGLGAAQTIGNITLAGTGTALNQNNTGTTTFGTLTVNGTPSINLAASGSLVFSGATWTSGLLTINNWTGGAYDPNVVNSGATGSAIFITTQPSDSFLANVQFTGDSYPQGAQWVTTVNGAGELVPVPEPGVYASIFGLGLLGFAVARRRMLATA